MHVRRQFQPTEEEVDARVAAPVTPAQAPGPSGDPNLSLDQGS